LTASHHWYQVVPVPRLYPHISTHRRFSKQTTTQQKKKVNP
jgi:hypothetical protein